MALSIKTRIQALRELYEKWGFKAAQLRRVNAKAAELQPREDLTPSLRRRLARWVEQIAGLEAEERDIISQITAIEERHHALRKKGGLRRAVAAKELEGPAPTREGKKKNLWFWLLLLWLLRNNKKPTPL